MKQALVDDTEDVSLDFGNEEELALRKARIRMLLDDSWLVYVGGTKLMKMEKATGCLKQKRVPQTCHHQQRLKLESFGWA